jgi:hypothetical protein
MEAAIFVALDYTRAYDIEILAARIHKRSVHQCQPKGGGNIPSPITQWISPESICTYSVER